LISGAGAFSDARSEISYGVRVSVTIADDGKAATTVKVGTAKAEK
jgi:hypothetical protein